MDRHYGELVNSVIEKNGVSFKDIAVKLKVNIRTINNWINTKNLDARIIAAIGSAIDYNFEQDMPGLFQVKLPSKIFIVDDAEMDSLIFKLEIKRLLGETKTEVFTNGDNAINKLLEISINDISELPDIIFLDLNMPIMDGWKFLEEFHRLDIDPGNLIRIFVLTSSIRRTDVLRAISNPRVETFISKPIHLNTIRSIFTKLAD